MTARELYTSALASIERYYGTVTTLSPLDWPISYIATSLLLTIITFFVITMLCVAATLLGIAAVKWLTELLKNLFVAVGIGNLSLWFDQTFDVRLGGTLFILLGAVDIQDSQIS